MPGIMQMRMPAYLRIFIKISEGIVLKKITAFIGSLGGGGAQGVFKTVMNYYASIGYEIIAVVNTLSNDVYSRELNSKIRVVNLGAGSDKESLPKIINYIRKHRIELAFAFSPELAVNLVIARKLSMKKFSIIGRCINTLSYEYNNADGLFRRVITKKLVEIFYHQVDFVVAQADGMRKDLIQNFGFVSEQVRTINNPLAEKYYDEMVKGPLMKRENYILYVGRFEKQKGLDMLLEAFSKISDTKIQLLLIGKGSLETSLKERAKQLQLGNRVEFLPFTKDIDNYYKNAKLTVMSSLFEGFPNVLSESISCGTPVVSFDLPSGPSDIIIDGVNGYMAEYLNVNDLTEKINVALSNSWNYWEVKNSAQRFSKDKILPDYRKLLELMENK